MRDITKERVQDMYRESIVTMVAIWMDTVASAVLIKSVEVSPEGSKMPGKDMTCLQVIEVRF